MSNTETFKRALESILARVFVSTPDTRKAIAVAYSGGLDSSVLLHLAHEFAVEHGITLYAFHVHHGLSPNADAWLAHCRENCERAGIAFDTCQVQVAKDDGRGLEASARSARYAALGDLCRQHRVPLLLTAHHQDDQVETVLLQMLRGAGLAGLSGMDEINTAPELLGDATLMVARPLLAISRTALTNYATANSVNHIEDESNSDSHHPRNALRNEVLPLLAQYFPAYRDCLTRGAQHAQAAQRMLNELAAQDLKNCLDGDSLDVEGVKALDDDRVANLFRHWLAVRGLRPPSTAWLLEARTQLLDARTDTQACVILGNMQLRLYRKRIVLVPLLADDHDIAPVVFHWQGEASVPFPAYGGTLHFDRTESGIDSDWLRDKALRLQWRVSGGRLKLAPNRPTRSLKDHYQTLGIPVWERQRLPVVYAGTALLFAAGIGQDCAPLQVAGGICLRWQADRG